MAQDGDSPGSEPPPPPSLLREASASPASERPHRGRPKVSSPSPRSRATSGVTASPKISSVAETVSVGAQQSRQAAPVGYGGGSGVSPEVSPPPHQHQAGNGGSSERWNAVSNRGEKGKYMVMGVLSSALDLAKAAVSHDEQGMLPEKVLPYYKKAIRAIDAALKLLPEHVAESTGIKRHRDNYQTRVDKLNLAVTRDKQQRDRRARQQSRVKFSKMELDPNHSTEPEPSHPARRSYWVLRLIRTTILHGGYLTPKLFAPKDVWTQVGLKVSGFSPRITALEAVLYMIIDRIKGLPKPQDAEARREAAQVMRAFREQAHKLQTHLSRHFPFVVPVDPLSSAKELGPKSNLGRLNNVMKKIGRNVKETAVGAVERIGAGIQGKHMDDELVYYKLVVSELCDKCQVFDEWFLHLQEQIENNDTEEMDELLLELHLVASFMREVICAMVLRDLETLLERYLRKMRKSFARMYWDEDYEKYEEEEVLP